MSELRPDHQRRLERYFESADRAQDWDAIYEATSLDGLVHQDRQALALEWIESLALPAGASALDVGCGPGRTAVAMADRGLEVTALDSSAEMRALASTRAEKAGVGERVSVHSGDAKHLGFEPGSYDLVVALGVLPYLASPERALRELARVTRAGGYIVVSSDNRLRLNRLLDPRFSPMLAPLRNLVKAWRRRRGAPPLKRTVPAALAGATKLLSLGEMEHMIGAAGMTTERTAGIGFGLFTFMGRVVLPERGAIRVHRSLMPLGARGVPGVQSVALQHLLLAHVS